MKYINIADGVEGLFIENHRFSTTHISVNLYLPLKTETIAVNALLPYLLSSCCKEYPDFSALNLRLSELYGADVGGVAEKIGDSTSQNEVIIMAAQIIAIVLLIFSLIFSLTPIVKDILYRDYNKYGELINDLRQIKLFYAKEDSSSSN